jgi:hypothetical protein
VDLNSESTSGKKHATMMHERTKKLEIHFEELDVRLSEAKNKASLGVLDKKHIAGLHFNRNFPTLQF